MERTTCDICYLIMSLNMIREMTHATFTIQRGEFDNTKIREMTHDLRKDRIHVFARYHIDKRSIWSYYRV